MAKIYFYDITSFKEYEIDLDKDIFEQILEIRKNSLDPNRFFLKYMSKSDIRSYDFSTMDDVYRFSDMQSMQVKGMAGCNLSEESLEKGARYSGIKISDPKKIIKGQFGVRDHVVTYNPLLPYFYEERDLIKFARDGYFSSIDFEELAINQIEHGKEFLVQTRRTASLQELIDNNYNEYISEVVSKEEMMEYATDPGKGEKILLRNLQKPR